VASRIAFIDRQGKAIGAEAWKERQKDASYVIVSQYDNGVVQVTLKWNGRIENPQNTFPSYWPVFVLLVKNYKADGTLALDPESDQTFGDEASAVKAYEDFLVRWTESTTNEEGEFVEQDNLLTPPAPPNPDLPESDAQELGETGAW
jgi:hypothetical protein